MRKLLETFSMGGMKERYHRLLGMKIGKNSLVGGTIMDPCLTEFGDNCTMGLFSVIYCHLHDYEKGTITMKSVKIGNNVIIGAGAIIMPGAVIKDNVKLAAGSVVRKGQILKRGNIYGGIPAKVIKKN
jgi:acetyltransferase-like isoleucine patch superfamily enzyme